MQSEDRVHLPKPVMKYQMRNPVPTNPHGPYFKEIDVLSMLKHKTNIPPYRTSSLEKHHVWQLHLGPNLGVKLDLVDQESFLNSTEPPPVDPLDRAVYSTEPFTDQQKSKLKKSLDNGVQPWFFRQTTYIENNPFREMNRTKVGDSVINKIAKKKLTHDHKDIFSVSFIDQSFSMVDETVNKLVEENSGKRKLLWSQPLLPEISSGSQTSRAIVRFDDDPTVALGYSAENTPAGDGDEPLTKRFRVEDGIILNVRKAGNNGTDGVSSQMNVTLVAPSVADSDDSKQHWVKDFNMEIQDAKVDDGYVLSLAENGEYAIYVKVTSRIDMKRIPFEFAEPHACHVIRDVEV
jgi:hypothetical protein